tara:strand:- start:170 stop:535 length:366 start_codon:yes stop_codon:yes gene_type:complete
MTTSKNIIENVLDENIISAKENISKLLYSKMNTILEKKKQDYIPQIYNIKPIEINEEVAESVITALTSIFEEKKRTYKDRETIYGVSKDEYMKLTDDMKRKVKERFYFERERARKKKARKR